MNTLRWIARIAGALMVLFVLSFVLAEGPPPWARLTAAERAFALGMTCLFGGLVVAWFRPPWGGALTLAGWAVLWFVERHPPLDWPFSLPAAIGLVHLVAWWGSRSQGPEAGMPLWVKAAFRGPLPVFVLLCANEIFGNPPLLTGGVPADLSGTWSSPQATFVVSGDGAVTGVVKGVAITGGRIQSNRTAFGRLVGWRTDYKIGGNGFFVLVDRSGGELAGSLVVSGVRRAERVRLRRS